MLKSLCLQLLAGFKLVVAVKNYVDIYINDDNHSSADFYILHAVTCCFHCPTFMPLILFETFMTKFLVPHRQAYRFSS